jgi:hypothetical protein
MPRKARLPPRWFIVTFWHVHRRIVRASRGPGAVASAPRKVRRLASHHDGPEQRRAASSSATTRTAPTLTSMAMNGWGAAEPAWWLNLQAHPEAVVELAGGIKREVFGRAAMGGERERLWQRWRELDKKLDEYAARRARETAVFVLEPRPVAGSGIGSSSVSRSEGKREIPAERAIPRFSGADHLVRFVGSSASVRRGRINEARLRGIASLVPINTGRARSGPTIRPSRIASRSCR